MLLILYELPQLIRLFDSFQHQQVLLGDGLGQPVADRGQEVIAGARIRPAIGDGFHPGIRRINIPSGWLTPHLDPRNTHVVNSINISFAVGLG